MRIQIQVVPNVKKQSSFWSKLIVPNICKCWRPLNYNTNWPRSYELLGLQPLTLCESIIKSRSDNHCASCLVVIQSLRPLHYHNICNDAQTQMPPIANTKPKFGSPEQKWRQHQGFEEEMWSIEFKVGIIATLTWHYSRFEVRLFINRQNMNFRFWKFLGARIIPTHVYFHIVYWNYVAWHRRTWPIFNFLLDLTKLY